jgi:FKBP-type peptidyl-prolyl cis-trans isomerase SlyD
MTITDQNCVVGIEYELKEVGRNEILDSNRGGQPLEFIMGNGNIIPGLEKALVGMKKDEKGDILVPASEAYQEYNSSLIQTLPIEDFYGIKLEEGMVLYGHNEHGETIQAVVKSFNNKEVTMDFNHPLAGKDLLFSLSVVSVRKATADEIASGEIASRELI